MEVEAVPQPLQPPGLTRHPVQRRQALVPAI